MSDLIKSISRKEWVTVIFLALLMVFITAVPYLYGYFTTPDDMVYTGIHHLTPGDTNVQLSMIEQVKQGDNVFINLYTSEPQARVYINPVWLPIGWLAKIFNLSSLLAMHLARSFLIVVFIFVMYLFLTYFFPSSKKRKWALVLILFASGLGVFFNPFLFDVSNIYEHPTDIWIPESITFLTLYHLPHLIASLTLIILIFLLMLLAFENNKLRYSIGAGVAGLFLLWFHPFNGPTIYLVLATYLLILFLWQRKIYWSYVKHYIILCVIPVPAVLYLFLMNRLDWVIHNWSAQNILPSPSVWMYLIGYGFLLLLALIGVWITLKKPENKRLFLISWFISSALLLYIPLSFQRRMSEGLHIPLAIFAVISIFYFIEMLDKKEKKNSLKVYAFVMVLVIFLPLTNIQILGQDIFMYNAKKTLPYYLYSEEVEGMRWLKNNLAKEDVVLSSYYMGNYIPAYSGRIVWIGHGPQTINLIHKEELSQWFWQDNSELERKYNFLKDENIDYVFYSRKEKEIGNYDPGTKNYFRQVFSNSQVKIYKVL